MTPTPITRIVIADDHEVYRKGLKFVFKKQDKSNIKIVAEASNGIDLMEMVEKHSPDVVLTDVRMPKMNGIEAAKLLKRKFPGIGIIALTSFEEELVMKEMFDAGIKAYLLKNTSTNEIIEAIYTVKKGEVFYSSSNTQSILKMLAPSRFQKIFNKSSIFNERELSIIKMVCKQLTNKEIAEELHLSIRTVEDYMKSIKEKTGSLCMVGVIIWALRNEVVVLGEIGK